MNGEMNARTNNGPTSKAGRSPGNGRTVRRLGRTALFGLVRGIATAAGSGLIAGIIWWMRDH
ncbi:hypothetical protein ACIA6D_30290 [Streptomyces cacaoi]